MYGLFGKFVAVEGERDNLASILVEASRLLEKNADCMQYIVGKSEDSSDVWVSEIWRSKEAHDSSLEPESIRNLIMTARPLIADMPEGTEYEVIDGKGLSQTKTTIV
ncbi:antibiotic biosynthesis monooxygenase [Candidatus Saccharibacteria bacterium]|jgi:quinol monooxygenase YgiN|nr:antibiotic biosynthesis monooxygenase [Candidatus Saccharibacteria bacterium]